MKFTTAAVFGAFALDTAVATPLTEIFGRAIGESCGNLRTLGSGKCQTIESCKGISYPQAYCPHDPEGIQCCVEIECKNDKGVEGVCSSVRNNGCPNGSFFPGVGPNFPCPGDDDVQCCISGPAPGAGGPEPAPTVPQNHAGPGSAGPGGGVVPVNSGGHGPVQEDSLGVKILNIAKGQAGLPYAWGGGDCDGPTDDQPPWDNGETGFDCSGLVSYAVCQATERRVNLFAAGLRQTSAMYCGQAHLHVPFAEKQPGDAVFFTNGDASCPCANGGNEGIHHVGLFDHEDTMFNAPNDDVNEVKWASIEGFSSPYCPSVVRFQDQQMV